ncbi:MAG TPA: hypothetical protein VMB25_06605 [Bryobacteraceae bacterium]|nr:hypothetical protein [Bryobacteraceae bacterium]
MQTAERAVTPKDSQQVSAEQRLKETSIQLPSPPEPFGTYVEAVQTGKLPFVSGMLPTEGAPRNLPVASARSWMWRRGGMRLVFGVASLPLGVPVELEIIFEVAG